MHYDQAQAMVLYACGQIESLRPQIKDTMEFVKATVLERNPLLRPWFIKETRLVAYTAEDIQFDLPTDFLAKDQMGFIRWEGDRDYYKELMKFQEAAAGDTCMKAFLFRGSYIELLNPVSVSGNFEVHGYYETLPLRETPATNPWLLYGADLLIARTAEQMLKVLNDDVSVVTQMNNAAVAERRILAETLERENGGLI